MNNVTPRPLSNHPSRAYYNDDVAMALVFEQQERQLKEQTAASNNTGSKQQQNVEV
jgi:hypothetical protein